MNRIEQQANTVIVNHNPDMEVCAWADCQEVLFGECVHVTITETSTKKGYTEESKKREWLLCCPECYIEFDRWFEEIYMAWAGDDHIATIDNGMNFE